MSLTKEMLIQEYVKNKKTDKVIANELEIDRTAVVHLRKAHGIPSRKRTGEIGEVVTLKALKDQGFQAINMNEMTKTFPFDFLVNSYLRIEVKSSVVHESQGHKRFSFLLSEKPENHNKESNYRIILPNGRTKKLFRKTCDFLILAGISDVYGNQFFIMSSHLIPDGQMSISIPVFSVLGSKYDKFKNNWILLRR